MPGEVTEAYTGIANKNRFSFYLKRFSNSIIWALETLFYHIGKTVATSPVFIIIGCLLLCGVASLGLKYFHVTEEQDKLWVPVGSQILVDKKWVDEHFPARTRFTSVIIAGNNVLVPSVINAMMDLYVFSKGIWKNNHTLETMCLRVGPYCSVSSLLELWLYNETVIRSLSFKHILETVNTVKSSPMFNKEYDVGMSIGNIRRDFRGEIIGADALSMVWLLEDNDEWTDAAMAWEADMIGRVQRGGSGLDVFIYTTRSFDDEGYGAVNNDIVRLSLGFFIVFIFVILSLGRFSLIEHKFYLSIVGLSSVGLAIAFAYGVALTLGVIYGPIHSIMPFLLLGIGVDDMFVIVEAWKNLDQSESKLDLPERVAMAMKHAGVSITVTSLTDIVAFGIGASTVIPALSAFCIYAAVGIAALYLLQATYFVACMTLDQMRIEKSRDAFIVCYKHDSYTPNKCSQQNFLSVAMGKYYGPYLLTLPGKVCVLVVTAVLFAVNMWGFTELRQHFSLTNYIPRDSYAYSFVGAKEQYFPDDGIDTAVYCGEIGYRESRAEMEKLSEDLRWDEHTQNGTVISWYEAFSQWTADNRANSSLVEDGFPRSEVAFRSLLRDFLYKTSAGQIYSRYVKMTDTAIIGSYISLRHRKQADSAAEIRAMDSIRETVREARLPEGKCFAYTQHYLTYETNKVLKKELYQNLGLAGGCVFLVTLVLIADLKTSLLVSTCVFFTLIDVGGTLHFWGVTIDTASSILLILAVGLAVDYSAHVGHTFMKERGTRRDRAISTLARIGPAVFNGGFSTFLAFVLLADSKSYGFTVFFRVFFTVVLFGLFHGLAYLPVILSWIGSAPYDTGSLEQLPKVPVAPAPNTNVNSRNQPPRIGPNKNKSPREAELLLMPAAKSCPNLGLSSPPSPTTLPRHNGNR
ncbi:hypothetical protein ScPMuIL_002055 [Solemya velum]